jgi:CPA1 family monovalent cation:H+ antiporter
MTPFQIIAALVTLSAIGAYINHRYFGFPQTIGLMAFAFAVSLVAIILSRTGIANLESLGRVVGSIDFSDVLLHGMLSFLLFAGAMQINLEELKNVRWSVGVMATVGVIGATFITGALVWQASRVVGLELPYMYALLFGALISPTDPIAVLAILKDSGISRQTYTRIGAESLFNDGVGVVLFLTILQLANSAEEVKVTEAAGLFLRQALGGALFGIACGWAVYRLLRPIDDYKVEVLLTLALATGGYAAAEELVHVSAPIFMVTAGLIVGNHGRNIGMSERTRERLDVFWELVDEVLNAVLFILIGLEIVVISVTIPQIILGILAIVAVLAGRFLSVGIPAALVGLLKGLDRGTIALLTWGGLRGGLSIAMALSLPAGPQKDIILPVTYIVVLFSILVQGLTFKSALPLLLRLP